MLDGLRERDTRNPGIPPESLALLPQAPFFKSADYGIVGDAFEVIPKLIEEIKRIN